MNEETLFCDAVNEVAEKLKAKDCKGLHIALDTLDGDMISTVIGTASGKDHINLVLNLAKNLDVDFRVLALAAMSGKEKPAPADETGTGSPT